MRETVHAAPGAPLVRLRRARPPDRGPAMPPPRAAAPAIALRALDTLWFQVAGTVCNLRCTHCFINCAPENHDFWFLTLADVRRYLEESVAFGTKEYYFTGGEPFMNREIVAILQETLRYGPATVLTNATLLKERDIAVLAEAERVSPYSLEFRVSIDAPDAQRNDAIRGAGSLERALQGIERLVRHDFLPIITAMRIWPDTEDDDVRRRFVALLRARGYARPRLKILPPLRIGREAARTHGYQEEERVTHDMLDGYDADQLICAGARVVTSRGIWCCPILLEAPDARLGASLAEAARPVPLGHAACYTCWRHGAICSNYAGMGER